MVIFCQEVAGMKFERIKNMRVDMDLSQKDIGQVLHCQREVYIMSAAREKSPFHMR